MYKRSGSKINHSFSYTAEQGGAKSIVKFNLSTSASVEIKPKQYNESAQSIPYDYSSGTNSNSNYSITIWKNKTGESLGRKIKTIEATSGNISLRDTDIEGETELIIGLHSSLNKHGLDAIYYLDKANVNVTMPAKLVDAPLYYSEPESYNKSNDTLLFEFNTNLSHSQGKINTNFARGGTTTVDLGETADHYHVDGKLLYVYLTVVPDNSRLGVLPEIDNISIKNIRSTTSNTPYNGQNVTPKRVDAIISKTGRSTVTQGSNVGFNLPAQRDYYLSKDASDSGKYINASDPTRIRELDTDSLPEGHYSLKSSSGNINSTVQIVSSTLSVELTDTVSKSHIPVSIAANGTERTAVLSLLNSSTTKVYQKELLLESTTNTSRSIPVSQPGNYTVKVRDLNTGITATQDVDVVKNRTATIRTNSPYNRHSGSQLDLSLNSTYDRSLVSLSGYNTSTTLKLKTSDRGPTPVRLNTYATPESPSEFVSTGSGVSVESVEGDTDHLSPGTYDLTLRSEHGTAVTNDTATVTVEPRSTDDLSVYTTRRVAPGGFGNASEVRDAIADGTLAPATSATANDTVVYAVNATGLTGLPASANASLERGADLARLDGLSFGVAPTDASSGTVDAATEGLGRVPNESAVHFDRRGLFLVADGERAFGTETPPATGRSFEATFRVDDARLRRTAADDDHRVTAPLRYESAAPADGGGNATEGDTTGVAPVDDAPNEPEAPSASGPSGGSGGSGGSGASGESGASGGSEGSSGPTSGGSTADGTPVGGSAGSASEGNDNESSVPFGTDGSPGSSANRSTAGPGARIPIAPGASEPLPTVGPSKPFGTGRFDRGANGPSSVGSGPVEDAATGGGEREDDDPTAADSAASTDSATAVDSPSESDPSPDETAARDLGYDEAPIRSTAYDLPGFGPVASLAGLAAASLVARRRRRGS